jgi:hypothetical protein
VLALTGAVPREELTPNLLRARIDALREDATHTRDAQDAAIKMVKQAEALQKMLEEKLEGLRQAVVDRNDAVTLRILDDSTRARVDTMGAGFTGAGSVDLVGALGGFGTGGN